MALESIKEGLTTHFRIITKHKFGTFGALVLLFFSIIAIFAPYIAPHTPWETLRTSAGKLALLKPPSGEFLLGTTAMGRDLFSQMIFATRTTVYIGFVSGMISIIIGANIGLISGFYGGKLDEVLMRFTDIVWGMPFLPFIIILISLFGRKLEFVILAICLVIWRSSARVIRAQTL
ncbi:MAG: ABC transporter permease, partial [Deltaproteobacteria bacterium]|nr:ABC transporter permease [Deltaproteobacteria bacterium]